MKPISYETWQKIQYVLGLVDKGITAGSGALAAAVAEMPWLSILIEIAGAILGWGIKTLVSALPHQNEPRPTSFQLMPLRAAGTHNYVPLRSQLDASGKPYAPGAIPLGNLFTKEGVKVGDAALSSDLNTVLQQLTGDANPDVTRLDSSVLPMIPTVAQSWRGSANGRPHIKAVYYPESEHVTPLPNKYLPNATMNPIGF